MILVTNLARVAAAAVQGQGGLDQQEEEEENEEQGARMVPAAWLTPHQLDQGGWLATITLSSGHLSSSCLPKLSSSSLPMVSSSCLPMGAQAPLAHVSGAESLLAHQEMLHFWKKVLLKLLHRDISDNLRAQCCKSF